MTDPTLTLALVVSGGMTIFFLAKWHEALATIRDKNEHIAKLERIGRTLAERLDDTEAALHAKVAAETRGGDPEGPVAA